MAKRIRWKYQSFKPMQLLLDEARERRRILDDPELRETVYVTHKCGFCTLAEEQEWIMNGISGIERPDSCCIWCPWGSDLRPSYKLPKNGGIPCTCAARKWSKQWAVERDV